jgi:hypothetical protein
MSKVMAACGGNAKRVTGAEYQASAANAACAVGLTMVSKAMQAGGHGEGQQSVAKLRSDFLTDLRHHLVEAHGPDRAAHLPVAAVDLFELFVSVLRLGGLQAVLVRNQFDLIGEELGDVNPIDVNLMASTYIWLLGTYEITFISLVATQPPLLHAAMRGDVSQVSFLLGQGAAIDSTDREGNTALHAAAHKGCLALAEHLLARNASLEVANRTGITPLSLAAARGHEAIVDLLLECGADATVVSREGNTPMFYAASKEHEKVCRVLLKAGVSVTSSVRPEMGLTALHVATARGNVDLVALLLGSGSSVDALDAHNRAPLHFAAYFGQAEVAAILMRQGADARRKTLKGLSPAAIATSQGFAALGALLSEFAGL